MASVLKAMKAKSDQLNYVDIGASGELQITIENVVVRDGDQPVSVFYHGCENRPWKPSKGMIRVLAAAWGEDSDYWVGKSALLYGEQTVTWAGKEIGGIRVKALSDIDKKGLTEFIAINSTKRVKTTIPFLDVKVAPVEPTSDDFAWIDAIKNGAAKLEDIENEDYRTYISGLL